MPLRNWPAAQRCSMNTCSSVRISTLDFQLRPRLFEPRTAGLRRLRAEEALLVAEMLLVAVAPRVAVLLVALRVLLAVVAPRADGVRGPTSCATWT